MNSEKLSREGSGRRLYCKDADPLFCCPSKRSSDNHKGHAPFPQTSRDAKLPVAAQHLSNQNLVVAVNQANVEDKRNLHCLAL